LCPSVLQNTEVTDFQASHRLPLIIEDGDVKLDDIGAHAEQWRLIGAAHLC
jgi:hypothetical protein